MDFGGEQQHKDRNTCQVAFEIHMEFLNGL